MNWKEAFLTTTKASSKLPTCKSIALCLLVVTQFCPPTPFNLHCTVFIQHHIAFSRKWLKRLSDENAKKEKQKWFPKSLNQLITGTTTSSCIRMGLHCHVRYNTLVSEAQGITSWSKLQVVFSLQIKQTYPVHCLVWCILCIDHLSLKCLFRQWAW